VCGSVQRCAALQGSAVSIVGVGLRLSRCPHMIGCPCMHIRVSGAGVCPPRSEGLASEEPNSLSAANVPEGFVCFLHLAWFRVAGWSTCVSDFSISIDVNAKSAVCHGRAGRSPAVQCRADGFVQVVSYR
jgi:hypothetical protein